MGAMAISTLAGVCLVAEAGRMPLLTELLPFLKGMTLLFWATATWWIPILLALGAWRHLVKRYPLTYEHGYWAAVFPLGMYTVCTQTWSGCSGCRSWSRSRRRSCGSRWRRGRSPGSDWLATSCATATDPRPTR